MTRRRNIIKRVENPERKGEKMMEALTVKELYTLDETIAKDIFEE